jgi:hypothetical protein
MHSSATLSASGLCIWRCFWETCFAGFYASFPLYEQGAVDQLYQVVIDIHALRHPIDQVFDILFVHLLAS